MKEDLEPVDPALIKEGDLVILNVCRDYGWFEERGLQSGDEFIVVGIKKKVSNRGVHFDIFARPVSRAQDIRSTESKLRIEFKSVFSFLPDELRLPKFKRVRSPF